MGEKKRVGNPWIPGFYYGALIPPLSLNLMVQSVERSALFYQQVFEATVHYYDEDFGAVRVGYSAECMLHADHTHNTHPVHSQLTTPSPRGVGVQFRLLGIQPDELEARARAYDPTSVIAPATDKGHGWREVYIADPDGYQWAVGVLIGKSKETKRPSA